MENFLLGKTKAELVLVIKKFGGTKEHARILANYLYKKKSTNLNSIKEIPLDIRKKLAVKYSTGHYPYQESVASMDGTIKYLFKNTQGLFFETAYMPGDKRNTLCISTQSGCKMGCTFCMTGKLGYYGNLKSKDIINQILSIPERDKVNRIVLMGMGEPLDNFKEVKKALKILNANWGFAFGKAKITLSTIGIHSQLEKFLAEPLCNLALSLNSPFSTERANLMPIEHTDPISNIIELIRKNPLPRPLRVSFEYVALGNTNISKKHAKEIGQMLKGIPCHLNLIPLNSVNSIYSRPNQKEMNRFVKDLNGFDVLVSIRESRGQDIGAACGQLAYTNYKNSNPENRSRSTKRLKLKKGKGKIAFVINPISGGAKGSSTSDSIFRQIDKSRFVPTIAESQCKGDAKILAETFVKEGFKRIVAVGGDGTVNEVAHALIHTNSVLGIIPKGSGNGLARHLNIPISLGVALELLKRGRIINIDYGILNNVPFFCTAGVGFDALVGNKFATLSGRGLTNYLKTILNEYFNYIPQYYQIEINGQTIVKEAFLVTVANASQWGNNAFIAPNADLQDGLLDVTIVSPFPKFLSPSMGIMLLNKEIGKSGYVEMFKVKDISITRDKPGYVHYDGEPSTMGKKLFAHIKPAGLKVIVP